MLSNKGSTTQHSFGLVGRPHAVDSSEAFDEDGSTTVSESDVSNDVPRTTISMQTVSEDNAGKGLAKSEVTSAAHVINSVAESSGRMEAAMDDAIQEKPVRKVPPGAYDRKGDVNGESAKSQAEP